jgi:hypothetical protein
MGFFQYYIYLLYFRQTKLTISSLNSFPKRIKIYDCSKSQTVDTVNESITFYLIKRKLLSCSRILIYIESSTIEKFSKVLLPGHDLDINQCNFVLKECSFLQFSE